MVPHEDSNSHHVGITNSLTTPHECLHCTYSKTLGKNYEENKGSPADSDQSNPH